MELIPILAFVVLVATIGTFIFAIGAYILFKIRESRLTFENEQKITAYPADIYTAPIERIDQPIYPEMRNYNPQHLPDNFYRPTQQNPSDVKYHPQQTLEPQRSSTSANRFMRFTNKGYENLPKNNSGNDPQWR